MPKSKYETHVQPYLERLTSWLERGCTLNEAADKLGVAKSTMSKYVALGRAGKEPYVELANAVAHACAEPDDHVEGRFYRRCIGYRYAEETTEERLDKNGQVHLLHKTTIREVPPDVEACKWWMANRMPKRWSYRPDDSVPADDDDPDNPSHGVVLLPPVMEAPPPPEMPKEDTHE